MHDQAYIVDFEKDYCCWILQVNLEMDTIDIGFGY